MNIGLIIFLACIWVLGVIAFWMLLYAHGEREAEPEGVIEA